MRRSAGLLMRAANRLLPHDRHEWGAAMAAELDYIGDDAACLRWATGCLFAGLWMRITLALTPARWSLTMRRKIMMSCSALLILTIVSAGGIYARMKPYQEARLIAWWHGQGKPPAGELAHR